MPEPRRETLTGWGRTSPSTAEVVRAADAAGAAAALDGPGARGVLPRGLGRAYGDAAQNGGGRIVMLPGLDAIGPVDASCGMVTAGGGVHLDALIHAIVPQGWFVPVTPGTQHVTIGGAIAADVHGKNHHVDGSIGRHVASLTLLTADAASRRLSPEEDASLFWATVGGMGLTGVILEATLRLIPIESARILVDTERTRDLDDTMARMDAGDDRYRYSVAWVDIASQGRTLGRGVLGRGDHAPARDGEALEYRPRPRVTTPPFPVGAITPLTVRAFNEVWFRKSPAPRRRERQAIDAFFYPLDIVDAWNRVYGPRGFIQYQFAVPFGAEQVVATIAEDSSRSHVPPWIVVLKRFGEASPGPLSFPIPGWTLAIDFPAARDARFAAMLDRWDERVAEAGGRVYLAKDARMRPELLPAMYPRLDEWRRIRDEADPGGRFASDLDRRLNVSGRHR